MSLFSFIWENYMHQNIIKKKHLLEFAREWMKGTFRVGCWLYPEVFVNVVQWLHFTMHDCISQWLHFTTFSHILQILRCGPRPPFPPLYPTGTFYSNTDAGVCELYFIRVNHPNSGFIDGYDQWRSQHSRCSMVQSKEKSLKLADDFVTGYAKCFRATGKCSQHFRIYFFGTF